MRSRLVFLVLCLWEGLWLSASSTPTLTPDPISTIDKFILCDLNRDRLIDREEFQDCARFPSGTNLLEAVEEIYKLFDVDKDDQLDKQEFELFFKMVADHEREVEVLTSDGKQKTMKQGEFMKMEEERRKGFTYENGQVSKVNEGSSDLDSIREENPELSRFITLGRWAHHHITQLGYATGNITGMRSLEDLDSSSTLPTEAGGVEREYFEVTPPPPCLPHQRAAAGKNGALSQSLCQSKLKEESNL
jgi:hypothetical protein